MKFFYLINIFSILCFFNSCKNITKENLESPGIKGRIGFLYVLKKTTIYREPDLNSPVVAEVSEEYSKLDILKDPNLSSDWLKVQSINWIGYISFRQDFEFEKNNIHPFRFDDLEYAHIESKSLRLREKPDLKSNIIKTIYPSDFFSIKAIGGLHQLIDGIYDTWLWIQTKDGQQGFLFNGYVDHNISFGYSICQKLGFIELIADSEGFLRLHPGSNQDYEGSKSLCSYEKTYVNKVVLEYDAGIHDVCSKTFYKGKEYFKIDKLYSNVEGCSSVRGWIEANKVPYFKNIREYTYPKYAHKFDPKLVEKLSIENFKSLEVNEEKIKFKSPFRFFRILENSLMLYYADKNGEYYFVTHMESSPVFFDLGINNPPLLFTCDTMGINFLEGSIWYYKDNHYLPYKLESSNLKYPYLRNVVYKKPFLIVTFGQSPTIACNFETKDLNNTITKKYLFENGLLKEN